MQINPFIFYDKKLGGENNKNNKKDIKFLKTMIKQQQCLNYISSSASQKFISKSIVFEDSFKSNCDEYYETYNNYNKNVIKFLECYKKFYNCNKQLSDKDDFLNISDEDILNIKKFKKK